VVRLPLLAESARRQERSAEVPRPTGSLRILVVDDNRDAADSLAMLLRITGHETHTAHDGEEAIAAARRLEPAVILLDLGLPRLNGFETCREIRQQAWARDAVIVALTGWGQDDDRRRSSEAGFDAHLVKPVDHTELLALIADVAS
jgi:DNA-binding response OmpR family regulator